VWRFLKHKRKVKKGLFMKKIAILGATGSVGMQAVDVCEKREYSVDLISAHRDFLGAEALARRLSVSEVVMTDESAARELSVRLRDTDIKVSAGTAALCSAIFESGCETVVNAILGEAGLAPTLAVIDARCRLALANKESLVVAGEIVMDRVRTSGVELIPVDSEHSAIFQSLMAGKKEELRRIILTASGGPFFGKGRSELSGVTLADALSHPTWNMGAKITVDSATLMNKGLEVIEASHLFGVKAENIEVVVHRESILHSAVEYIDNTVIGEMSVPDMRACIQYALDYPNRLSATVAPLDFKRLSKMTFAEPDFEAFPLLPLAFRAAGDGGAMPAILNALDEVAADAFLKGKIGFLDISDIIISLYGKMSSYKNECTLEGILAASREARGLAQEKCN
jgi:1-deoxy-D-xylulose-5-phosphate reductoisomerase